MISQTIGAQCAAEWNNAVKNNINTTGRIKLYSKTEELTNFIKNNESADPAEITRACKEFIDGLGFEHSIVDWIADNTSFQVNKGKEEFSGAYKVFHELFDEISKKETPPEVLKKIDTDSHNKIIDKEAPMIKGDPFLHIASDLSLFDRLALRGTSKTARDLFAEHEVNYYNTYVPCFKDLLKKSKILITDIEKYIALLGDKKGEIQNLNLLNLPHLSANDLNTILINFPNVKNIICNKPAIIDLIKDNPNINRLECRFKIDLKDFPEELIPKLTGAELYPSDDKELEEVFFILKDVLPKFNYLLIKSDKITKLPNGYAMPMLKIGYFFSCSALTKVGDMPMLQEGCFNDCPALTEVGDMPMLLAGDFRGCYALTKVGDMPMLQTCNFIVCPALTKVGDMAMLQKGNFDDCSALTEVGDMPMLQSGRFYRCLALTKVGDMPMLQEGEFSDCPALTKVGDMPMLQSGNFIVCPALTEVGDMPMLQTCNFFVCSALTEVGNMPMLQKGNFDDCSALTEVGNMPMLQIGNFSRCPALTKVGDMPMLQEVVFSDCPALTEVGDMPSHLNPLPK